jgi:hypothetical protein
LSLAASRPVTRKSDPSAARRSLRSRN